MIINRNELLKALQETKAGVARKGIMEQATHFIFSGDHIITYDDTITIRYPFKTDFQCSVSAKEFYQIISSLDYEEIEIELKDKELVFQAEGMKAVLLVLQEIEDLFLIEIEDQWKKLPIDFLEGITFCLPSVAEDFSRGIVYTHLLIEKNIIASTDNHRLSHYQMQSEIKDDFLLSSEAAKNLIGLSVIEYNMSDNWISFRTEKNIILSSRKIEGSFPDISTREKLLSHEEMIKIKFPASIEKQIETSSIFSEKENKSIEIKVENGKIYCIGESYIGKIEFFNSIEEEENFSFSINPDYFAYIMEKDKTAYLSENRILFVSDNFKHAVSLIKKI